MTYNSKDFTADAVKELMESAYSECSDEQDLEIFLYDLDSIKEYLLDLIPQVEDRLTEYEEESADNEDAEEEEDDSVGEEDSK